MQGLTMLVLITGILLASMAETTYRGYYSLYSLRKARMCCVKLEGIEKRLEDLEKLMLKSKDGMLDLRGNIEESDPSFKPKSDPLQPIGFLVTYDGPHIDLSSMNGNITLPYTTTVWNGGGGYDETTHNFIAPVAGLYVFHINALSGNHQGCIWLMKNSEGLMSGWAPEMYGTMHISTGLMLERGDRVSVLVCAGSTIDDDKGRNSFSGYLIRETKS